MEEAIFRADRIVGAADALPYAKRKVILKTNLVLLAGIAVLYVYLSGTIVSGNLEKMNKAKELAKVSGELDRVQAGILSADTGLSMGFFTEKGFIETKNLNVIKRINNVAATEEINTYQ